MNKLKPKKKIYFQNYKNPFLINKKQIIKQKSKKTVSTKKRAYYLFD